VGNDALFRIFCDALQGPAFADDPRFATNAARVTNRDELAVALEGLLAARPAAEWVDLLRARGIPCGVVHDVADAFAYARSVGLDPVVRLDREDGTSVDTVVNPLSLSVTPPRYRSAPPRLGEHTQGLRIGPEAGTS